jgi:hypothetical protein
MKHLIALALCLISSVAMAQTEGMELNLPSNTSWNPGVNATYAPFRPTTVRWNTAPSGSLISTTSPTDFAVKAWKPGIIQATGNVMFVLDVTAYPPGYGTMTNPNYTVRIFKNGAANGCNDGGGGPVASQAGYQVPGYWYIIHIPIAFATQAATDDTFRFCLLATTNGPNNYIDANPAHTRLTVTISSPAAP